MHSHPYRQKLKTLPDGAGLACGVFEYFLGLGDNRPKVLGATHFHEIFENGFLKPRPYLAYGYMEVRFEEQAEDVEDQITYLYKYEESTSFRAILTLNQAYVLGGRIQAMEHSKYVLN